MLTAGLADGCSYQYQWHAYDNASGLLIPISGASSDTVPATTADFLMVRIATACDGFPAWQKPVEVYLRNGRTPDVVGIERLPEDDYR